jgi:hypothetical protein
MGFFALMSRLISIVGFNEKEKAMPGHLEWRQLDSGDWVKVYVEDSPTLVDMLPDVEIPWQLHAIAVVAVLLFFVVVGVYDFNYFGSEAYKSKAASQSLQNGTTSTWGGDVTQTGNHFEMILIIDSIKNGSFHGKVHWPDQQYIHDTLTKAEGTMVANVNHKDIHWEYVDTCYGGKYLEFTETQFIQGNSVVLHAKYYAAVCEGALSGAWFYPDRPNDTPGGEFYLQWKSP